MIKLLEEYRLNFTRSLISNVYVNNQNGFIKNHIGITPNESLNLRNDPVNRKK